MPQEKLGGANRHSIERSNANKPNRRSNDPLDESFSTLERNMRSVDDMEANGDLNGEKAEQARDLFRRRDIEDRVEATAMQSRSPMRTLRQMREDPLLPEVDEDMASRVQERVEENVLDQLTGLAILSPQLVEQTMQLAAATSPKRERREPPAIEAAEPEQLLLPVPAGEPQTKESRLTDPPAQLKNALAENTGEKLDLVPLEAESGGDEVGTGSGETSQPQISAGPSKSKTEVVDEPGSENFKKKPTPGEKEKLPVQKRPDKNAEEKAQGEQDGMAVFDVDKAQDEGRIGEKVMEKVVRKAIEGAKKSPVAKVINEILDELPMVNSIEQEAMLESIKKNLKPGVPTRIKSSDPRIDGQVIFVTPDGRVIRADKFGNFKDGT